MSLSSGGFSSSDPFECFSMSVGRLAVPLSFPVRSGPLFFRIRSLFKIRPSVCTPTYCRAPRFPFSLFPFVLYPPDFCLHHEFSRFTGSFRILPVPSLLNEYSLILIHRVTAMLCTFPLLVSVFSLCNFRLR